MSFVIRGKWKKSSEGVYMWTLVTTEKQDIYNVLDEIRAAGAKYWETPNITKNFKTYHCLIKFYIPAEMGYPEESL
jgi:hypothetical protein